VFADCSRNTPKAISCTVPLLAFLFNILVIFTVDRANEDSVMAVLAKQRRFDLWNFVASCDGERCSLERYCAIRHSAWCPIDHLKALDVLLYDQQPSLRRYDVIKSGPQCMVIEAIERLASSYIRKGKVTCPPVPMDLVMLVAGRKPVEVRPLPLKAFHGALWREEDEWVIYLRSSDTHAQQRFTLFHESFHILASNRASLDCATVRTQNPIHEWAANHFAARMLMPREWLLQQWKSAGNPSTLSRIFDAPESIVCISLKRLGLV
jgi:hypothetical protein